MKKKKQDMPYKPEPGEVFYYGKCKRHQQPTQGEKCIACGKKTVSWYMNRENASDAQEKWEYNHDKSY